jgi:hypothetical protein
MKYKTACHYIERSIWQLQPMSVHHANVDLWQIDACSLIVYAGIVVARPLWFRRRHPANLWGRCDPASLGLPKTRQPQATGGGRRWPFTSPQSRGELLSSYPTRRLGPALERHLSRCVW